jgi:integrase
MGLTVKGIERLLREGKPKRRRHERNLFLQVFLGGSALWLFRYEFKHRKRWMSLGPYPSVSIKDAEFKAEAERRKIWNDRIDPLDEREKEREKARVAAAHSILFKDAAPRYVEQKSAEWHKTKYRKQFLAELERFVYPIIGSLPVSHIGRADILRVLEQPYKNTTFWYAFAKADEIRARIEAVLDWAEANEYPLSGANPARWRGHLDKRLPAPSKIREARNYPALAYSDLPQFMSELRSREGIAERALELCVLTAMRTGAVLGAKRSEINEAEATWTIPPERMKGPKGKRKEHRVPLTPRALTILSELPQLADNPHIFFGSLPGKGLHESALLDVLDRMNSPLRWVDEKERPITTHGFRATFKTWASEETDYPRDIIEKALAHTVGNDTERRYDRGDLLLKRARLMRDWGDYCERVAPIRAALRA